MSSKKDSKRNIEFLFEVGSLKNIERGWRQHLAMGVANNLEHTLRVIWLALIISRQEGKGDEETIMKMALVHDMVESRTMDLNYIQKVYTKADEFKAGEHMFGGTSLEDFYKNYFINYEARNSIEACIVKDADNLDIDFELKELAERGSKLPAKWQRFRKMVRDEKLYTKTAKRIWDEVQTADVADWHLNANKWIKDPNAGR